MNTRRPVMSAYYITEIEKKLTKLGISLDDQAYNAIFAEQDDFKFTRRLRAFNELLARQVDKIGSDDLDDPTNALNG